MSKELEALEELRDFRYGKDKLLVCQTQMYLTIKTALQRLESIDNSNLSEALVCLKHIKKYYIPKPCSAKTYDCLETIKQALLKAQEQKHYLKWEDLEFAEEHKDLPVLLNGSLYFLEYYSFKEEGFVVIKTSKVAIFGLEEHYINDVQFFNDLHLERVEE